MADGPNWRTGATGAPWSTTDTDDASNGNTDTDLTVCTPLASIFQARGSRFKEPTDVPQGMKYCRGDRCCRLLPRRMFAANMNTADGLDLYCSECNQRKREEKRDARLRYAMNDLSAVRRKQEQGKDGIRRSRAIDKYEQFTAETDRRQSSRHRGEALASIGRALEEYKSARGEDFWLSASQVYERVFGQQWYICRHTGHYLTPHCFMCAAHGHTLSLDGPNGSTWPDIQNCVRGK